eukprot:m.268149 g.268149  ORF g.268149 m.268149 type:complete len:105 (+) comp73484_c0_seq1:105-419(+)
MWKNKKEAKEKRKNREEKRSRRERKQKNNKQAQETQRQQAKGNLANQPDPCLCSSTALILVQLFQLAFIYFNSQSIRTAMYSFNVPFFTNPLTVHASLTNITSA